ncbi:MAG: LarC family nickel insertion protein, partial [Actinoplanes sp.]
MTKHAWIDVSAGVAGDMLLGALADAGARLDVMQAAVDAVLPGGASLTAETVPRAGLRAVKVSVLPLVESPPHRSWGDIGAMLQAAELKPGVRERAIAVFSLLAAVEGRVHGVPAAEVHFHEVGAVDSIADVVGVCAALEELEVDTVSAGAVALGSGRIRTAHGELPVPAPAVLELSRGWRVSGAPGGPSATAGFGYGELATPTGMAVIRAMADACEELPPLSVEAIGVGAGGRDTPGRPNVVRVVIGTPTARRDPLPAGAAVPGTEAAVLLEANVDDLDPRLWPGIL